MNKEIYWIPLKTIVTKEVRRFMRIWIQTLIPPAITMMLYFVIFGNLIGKRVGQMGGYDYLQFIVPGLVMMSVITNSYSNVVSSFFSTKFQSSIEELLVSPTPNSVIIIGYVAGGVCRGILVGALVTALALFFTDLHITHLGVTLAILLLTATVFSLGGMINAIYANKFDDISIVPTFVLTPLTYLGGVFYSISLLPTFWQYVSKANPIVYMINTFRYGILGVSDVSLVGAFSMTILFVILMYSWAWWLLTKGYGIRS